MQCNNVVKVIDKTENPYTCPRRCGPLKHGRSLDVIGKTTHCKKCKGILLTKEEIRKWEKKRGINKLRNNDLFNLLNSGSYGELPCPLCSNKMKELHLSYKKSRTMSRHEEVMKDPKRITGEVVLEFLPVIGALIQFGRFITEVGEDATKGKLKKTVTIDGCSSCSSFWFDRGEIIQITGNDVTLEYKGITVELAGANAKPSPNVTTAHRTDEVKPTKDAAKK